MQHDMNLEGACVAPSDSRPRRKIQVEDSLTGKFVRRWNFLCRYLRARSQFDTFRRFQPILDRHFDHEWLAGTAVRLRFLHGKEDREICVPWSGGKYLFRLRWLPWREEGSTANWSEPVTITVFKKGKDGGPRETVRYMSLFIKDRILHITQLQGVPLIEMPKGLRDWAERFVKATMEFAQQENFRAILLARAESLYSYHHPYIRRFLPPEVQERDLKRIRANVELHHNQTAITLGFKPADDWYQWLNPAYQGTAATTLPAVEPVPAPITAAQPVPAAIAQPTAEQV